MSIVTLLLMLLVGAVVIYGVKLALNGQWKELLVTVVVLIVALWILGALGLTLPSLPTVK